MNVKWNYVNVVGKPIKVCVQCSLCSFEPATRGESNPQKKNEIVSEKWREDERRATTKEGKYPNFFFLLSYFNFLPTPRALCWRTAVEWERERERWIVEGVVKKKGGSVAGYGGEKKRKKKLMAARVERGFECLSFNAKQNVFLGKNYYSKRNFSVVFPTNLTPSLSLNNTVVSNWVLLDFRLLTARLG